MNNPQDTITAESLSGMIGIVFVILWIPCLFFAYRNFKQAGHSLGCMWVGIVPAFAVGVLIYSRLVLKRWQANQTQEEIRRKQDAESRRQAEQRSLALRLSNLLSESIKTATDLPKTVQSAESALDVAEREFDDGAFAPFWDAVEQAANTLARVNVTIQQLIENSTHYKTEATRLDTPHPPFRLGVDTLPDASHTANRMRDIVRRAQKNFQFAVIYEQRKTNQLLVAGFSSLGHAINELGYRLDASLESLASSVSIAFSDVVTEIQISREQAAQDSESQREHEGQEREMLDNIQRRRKPPP